MSNRIHNISLAAQNTFYEEIVHGLKIISSFRTHFIKSPNQVGYINESKKR